VNRIREEHGIDIIRVANCNGAVQRLQIVIHMSWHGDIPVVDRSYRRSVRQHMVTSSMPADFKLDVLLPSIAFAIAQQHQALVSGVAVGLAISLIVRYFRSPWRKLPPGPRGFPLLGNVLDMRSKQWLKFTQ
jgi:hypothetical protein